MRNRGGGGRTVTTQRTRRAALSRHHRLAGRRKPARSDPLRGAPADFALQRRAYPTANRNPSRCSGEPWPSTWRAGQEVGKSCVVVTIGGKRVMFDCGMHMAYQDHRRYPDFSLLLAATGAPDYTTAISCVVITHFHQDHIGALPYFTEVCGYHGPIYMTVHKCVSGGGKVLIPTFALGRAQELCILLDDYWERMNLEVPIYLSAGLTIQSNMYYKMLIGWTSQKIKDSYTMHNPFDFKHVCHFERSYINNPGPCVLFATPGMIFGGFSLEVFKKWAPSEKNLVALPGYTLYCSPGSIGQKILSKQNDTHIDVRYHQLAFSPHTDSKGIMDLIEFLSPKHVILVHGEKPNMAFLKERVESELGMPCYYPANHESVSIPTTRNLKMSATERFITSCAAEQTKDSLQMGGLICGSSVPHVNSSEKLADGILFMEKHKEPKILCEDELLRAAAFCPV
ncbi:hypothetical protein PR202_gb22702 [Eleusine coracana subsp. coracana]|uniref:Beta-Casp domain-containing protein n=1 Tax=Eleusine coracana subsp. coracana TaxID=191504 RepID=A0AAV5FIF2_ELECO|nr:hypothetical protein PR202_gb22702 [Eleusine coracana subsp. coracana]